MPIVIKHQPNFTKINFTRLKSYEDPNNAIVSIRKVRPSRIQAFERELLTRLANEVASAPVLVDLEIDSLVVYAADANPDASIQAMKRLLGVSSGDEQQHREWIVRNSRYSPAFRFTLSDEDERLYSVARWCYLGSVDDWVFLQGSSSLETLARTYLPHAGKESYFDLM
ncbi:MAG: hypothetical protein HYX69_17445 [Planctomycetia bacterium]|nr:hypothetical protein [Planctomycetia bacterium]